MVDRGYVELIWCTKYKLYVHRESRDYVMQVLNTEKIK